ALHRLPPPDAEAVNPSCPPYESEANPKPEQKRERSQEVEAPQEGPSEKRLRADSKDNNRNSHRVENWLRGGTWPQEYFESGDQTWQDIKADTLARGSEADRMTNLLLARKKSTASLRRQALEASIVAPTEKTEDKSLPYRSAGYETELADQGSYLRESPEGITNNSELICQELLTAGQDFPQDSLFRYDLFEETCNKVHNRNEARVVEDISPLIAPSPETLKTYGAVELEHLVFNTNERWGESIPITKTRPQPDRCVGFRRSAFTDDQLQHLMPYIGSRVPIEYFSFFLATWRMYFPFFACEAKCTVGDIDVADKQNAHSMTMAVRGIVELFKLVKREDELNQEILAFSISHDAKIVRIYGHYALIKDRAATFYRHPIHSFDFTAQNGRDKWTAYQFTLNVYFEFMPKLHKLICSAIDKISLDQASQGSNLRSPTSVGGSISSTDLESQQPNSQEMAASASTPQNITGSKKRKATKELLEKENEQYKRQLHQLVAQVDLLKAQSLNFNSGNDAEVVAKLLQQLERQKQESEQRENQLRKESKQQLAQEKEESKQRHVELMLLLEQQKELINSLSKG
ncbi:MAG: hypothetical protein Q9187_003218, partial [Circinaria calcarea]